MVSIIIPVYNVKQYLEKCINSVINQNYYNLEIILVDDGSTDGSELICDNYKLIDNRIKVIHKDNGGLSEARNFGLDIAKGEYIAFLDSDDWIDKDYISILLNLIIKYNADISVCDYKKVYDEDTELNSSNDVNIYSNIDALNAIYTKNHGKMIVAWNKLYKKDILKQQRYPIGRLHEDEFLTPMLLYKANKIVITNKELVYYRQRKNSIMNSQFNLKKLDYLDALVERINFYKLKKLNSLYIKTIVTYIIVLIEFHYQINKSSLDNKEIAIKKINKKIKDALNEYKDDMPTKCKIRIMFFKLFPYIHQQYIISKIKKINSFYLIKSNF